MSGGPQVGLQRNLLASIAALFVSSGTLVCCALPALLVALGAGAALAGLVGTFPQLVWLSAHKAVVFGVAGAMLLAAGALQWKARSLPCPADPSLAAACTRTRRLAVAVYWVAVAFFAVGVFFAFIAPLLSDR
jgi:hypothetical protein